MWNSHASLGVAIIALYSPALIASLILVPRHGRPRRAWIFLALLSCIRVASGIVVILKERDTKHSVGLSTAAATLLGVGVYPLLFCLIGLFFIIQVLDFKQSRWLRACIIVGRLTTIISILLLVGGTCLRYTVDMKSSASAVGANLAKAGSIVAAVVLVGCLGLQPICWSFGSGLSRASSTILLGLLPAIALLGIRTAYLCVSVFNSESNSKWNALNGSIGLFAGLALVPEYLCLLVLIYVGFAIPRVRAESNQDDSVQKLTFG